MRGPKATLGETPMKDDYIHGWRGLEAFTGLKEHYLRRAIGVYGFPQPQKLVVRCKNNNTTRYIWDRSDIANWMSSPEGKGFLEANATQTSFPS